jgi:hypothetical protein
VPTYSVTLDVPNELIAYVVRLLRAERARRGTRTGTRALTCVRQALFVLAWFRDRPNVTRLGYGFGLSQATAYRYLAEGITVLAAQAPDLHQALERAKAVGLPHLILDGTTIGCDRVHETKTSRKGKEIDAWYSGKTHDFGGLLQALMAPDGVPLWISEVRPGSAHDITAARELVLAALAPYLRHLPVLADGGYDGAGHGVHTPAKKAKDGYELDPDTRTYNRLLRGLRCLGERGFALLTQRWTTLQHVMLSPRRIGHIARAALVLTHFEHRIIT